MRHGLSILASALGGHLLVGVALASATLLPAASTTTFGAEATTRVVVDLVDAAEHLPPCCGHTGSGQGSDCWITASPTSAAASAAGRVPAAAAARSELESSKASQRWSKSAPSWFASREYLDTCTTALRDRL